jgi:integrase
MTPRYVMQVGDTYRYNPPSDAVKAGVIRRKTFTDLREAQMYALVANTELDAWRKERKDLRNLRTDARVNDLVASYKQNISYASLNPKTRKDYDYYIKCWLDSKAAPMAKPLHSAKLEDLTTPTCQRIYEEAAEHSVSLANHSLSVYRLLFNYSIRHGFTQHNPFSKVLKRADKPRKVVWTRADIKAYLTTAYGEFKWRNVGLIVQMAHEWGQRLGDMRLLKWSSYDINTGVLTLEQSKRRATVTIPTSQTLQTMLKQQHAEYGWQEYIAPGTIADGKGGLRPYSITRLPIVGAEIMKAAGLPDALRLMDLRRTAISEMLEHGVPITNVMSVSGHASAQSLTPYLKHTLKSASFAQNLRCLEEM